MVRNLFGPVGPSETSAKNEACASQFVDHDTSRNFELENIDL